MALPVLILGALVITCEIRFIKTRNREENDFLEFYLHTDRSFDTRGWVTYACQQEELIQDI